MNPIQIILHPTDFSEASKPALELAGVLAREYGATLCLLHVVEPLIADYDEQGMVLLGSSERRRQKAETTMWNCDIPGVTVARMVREGSAAEEILATARKARVGLIVMGTHGRTGLSRALMGSIAEQVVRGAPCPVVTVKPANEAPLPEVRTSEPAHA